VAELEAALEHRERQIKAMRRISDALFSHAGVDAMVRETLAVALDVLCAEAGTLYLHDPATDTLVFRLVLGPAAETLIGQSVPASKGIAGQVFRTGVPDLTLKVNEHDAFNRAVDAVSGYQTESVMTVPVKRSDGDPIGVMQMLNAQGPSFDRRDLEVLQVLCAQAAAAIEHARLLQEARRAEIVHVIGDISHDIKNMLTPIQSGVWTLLPMLDLLFADLDAIRATCPETQVWADDIARVAAQVRDDYGWMLANALGAADQVQARTKEIADAIKGELSPPFFEEADLNDTAREVALPLRLVAERAEVNLLLDLDPDLPRAEFDRKQLYTALYNLVNNAIPETPAGGSVTLRTRGPRKARSGGQGVSDAVDADTLLVEVADTGRGIPEHIRSRLFTDAAVSTKPGGTGLGTRIVAGVVRRHNGSITVHSEEGRGSTFSIRLPLRRQE
jgi:signal transduction histidine kinase